MSRLQRCVWLLARTVSRLIMSYINILCTALKGKKVVILRFIHLFDLDDTKMGNP